jgi:predicted Zn-dependent protease
METSPMRWMPMLLLLMPVSVLADSLDTPRQLLESFDSDALPALQQVAKAEPKNVEALRLLGIAQLRAGKPADAVASLERAAKLDPRNAQLFHLLAQAYASNVNNVGMLSKLSYAGKIRGSFQKAVDLDPDFIDARDGLMQYYLMAPGIAGGSVEKARVQAAAIAERSQARGHMARAALLRSEEKQVEALQANRSAVLADPGYAPARLSLGLSLHAAGQVDEALDVFETMQRELPEAGQGWYQFARIALLSDARLEQAEAAMRHYLSLPRADGLPEPKYAHLRLGQILAKLDKGDAARAEIKRALALDAGFEDAKQALASL